MVSSITGSNLPVVKASTGETAALFRSMDFGVNTTIGRCTPLQGVPAEQVEVVGGGGRHGDGHRAFGAELQESFDPPGGVVGALAFVAVRQQQHNA